MTLLVFGLMTTLLGWHLQYLSFDFEFEKFFPRNDPDSQSYEVHKKQFGYDNDFLLLIIENQEGIFNTDFMKKVERLEAALSGIDGIANIASPLTQKHLINGPTGLLAFPLIHLDDSDRLKQDSIRIFSNPFYATSFSSDRASYSIYLTHLHFKDQDQTKKLVEEIRFQGKNSSLDHMRIVGKLTAQNVFIDFIQNDFGKYLLGCLALSFVLLLVLFRNFKSSLLPFLISLFSLVWSFGLMGLLGVKINLLSSLLPPILFFVSMSDAVHLMNAMHKAPSGPNQLQQAVRIVWTPTALTSVTTAIGFLSLLWINTEPIQVLGVFAATGILFAFGITFSFGLVLSRGFRAKKVTALPEIPDSFLNFLIKNPTKTAILVSIVVLIALPGILKLKVDAFLLDDLPADVDVRKDFDYADQFLGGSKPYEVRVVPKGTLKVWDQEVMNELYKIERYLDVRYPVARVQSPSKWIQYLNQANKGGLNENYRYPENTKDFEKATRLIKRLNPTMVQTLVTEDQRVCRIVGFLPELGSYETNLRNEKLLAFLEENIDKEKIDYQITGTTFLIDKSHELLSVNLVKGLLTAVFTIGLVLGIYFRSFKLVIISLIPNIIPLLLIAGILGWAGIALKMTTSIIFTIAFGIAVDDTIHMMSYFLKQKESDRKVALKNTFHHAGSAMLITSIIVIAGFSLFLFSDFGATYYLGLFVCLSLLIALIIDLTILPLLLLLIHVKKRRPNSRYHPSKS